MTVGLAATTLANKWLDMLAGTAFTAPAGSYVQLHTADPGAAGTTALSAYATGRQAITWSAASGGSKAKSNTPSFSCTGSETITHISVWDAASAGALMFTAALGTSKAITNGDTFQLSTLTVALTPIAA